MAAKNAEPPEIKEISNASIEVLNQLDEFFNIIEESGKTFYKKLNIEKVNINNIKQGEKISDDLNYIITDLDKKLKAQNLIFSIKQLEDFMLNYVTDDYNKFKSISKKIFFNTMKKDITTENLNIAMSDAELEFNELDIHHSFKSQGMFLCKNLIKPNRKIDIEATKTKKEAAYNNSKNIEKIKKGQTIIAKNEMVTTEIYKILSDLNLLEAFDYKFTFGVFVIMLLLLVLVLLYVKTFVFDLLNNKNNIMILSIIVVLTILIARFACEYSPIAIPIFIAPMLIAVLIDLRLSFLVNIILTIAVSFMAKGDINFIYISLISGCLICFLIPWATQRNKLFMVGIEIGAINVLIITCFGIINKIDTQVLILNDIIVLLNGIICVVFTIGILPFFESSFNVITPMKLLELSNSNQPLLRRLLTEAPGTYHHSLMVGNLAEAGTEVIGGDSLLARVGAYYHDIGKLKRPQFFMENQMDENPHKRITPNLSTLIITSHPHDGVELAKANKIPVLILDIIKEHHGTTLVAYFYHKAKMEEKGEDVKESVFRYDGPKPKTKESVVVMLADCVEAAVRSMSDKNEGKIEGLVRKIIRDKLDDGQLDESNLTLKDFDNIAKAFIRVFYGSFHARESYPVTVETKLKGAV